MSPSKPQRKPVDADAQTSRVERMKAAVRLEIRACTDRATEIVESVRRKVPPAKLVVVRR